VSEDGDVGSDLVADLFDRQVRGYVFDGHRPANRPLLALLGGQPGSGKSHAMAQLQRLRESEDLVGLTGDALRPFHPRYQALLADPFLLPNAVAPVTSEWVRRSIDHALGRRYSLVLEGTYRDPDVVAETIRRFAAAGYRTELVVLAVRQERSRLDSLLRFVNPGAVAPGRWTPPSAHDTAYEQLPGNVRRLEDVAELDHVAVRRRSAEVYSNERGPGRAWRRPGRAHEALVEEWGRPFEAAEAREWLRLYRGVMFNALAHNRADPRIVAVCAALHGDADRVAEMAHPDPDDPDRERHAASQQQLVAALEHHGRSSTSSTGGAATSAQARLAPIPVT
jgi:UDP-N-acetylglucosamine kinase